jgi:hypothetical protein
MTSSQIVTSEKLVITPLESGSLNLVMLKFVSKIRPSGPSPVTYSQMRRLRIDDILISMK